MSNKSYTLAGVWRRPIYATRTSAHALFAVIVWPFFTVLSATFELADLPYYAVPLNDAFFAALAGVSLLVPDMLAAGAAVFGVSGFIFRYLGVETEGKHLSFVRLGVEPLLALLAVVAGVALWYPGVFGHYWVAPLRSLPVAAAELLLIAVVTAGSLAAGKRGCRVRLAGALITLGVLAPVPLTACAALTQFGGTSPELVILGLDGISQADPVAPLQGWVERRGGTWYVRPVAPGLLTNPVWASILTMQPVGVHGVFHTFQPLPEGEPALLAAARTRGYHTVSVFPDQLTCAVGSRAGFDEDRSGPVGWRQVLLATVANNSFLIPVVRPVLPRAWPSAIPPNHAGTFTYDVRREIRELLRAGSETRRTLVVGHLTYTHLPAYPATRDLSWAEVRAIAGAAGGFAQDRAFDWQDADRDTDPVKLHAWKLHYLQRVIESEVDAGGFIRGGGRLILFSDHGDRRGLSTENFQDERYHRVLLATFGLPARCADAPVSLIDIASLAGISTGHATAAVEYTIAPQGMWPALVNTAGLRWSGDVDLDAGLLAQVFQGLRRHEPWQGRQSCAGGE